MSGAPQLDLFGSTAAEQSRDYPHTPGFKAHGASQEAAREIAGQIKRLQADVLAELQRWPDGRTADEIARGLERSPLSIRPRVTELKALGRIIPTGQRRRNDFGMSAAVWRVIGGRHGQAA